VHYTFVTCLEKPSSAVIQNLDGVTNNNFH
jgi:hypothetical protein